MSNSTISQRIIDKVGTISGDYKIIARNKEGFNLKCINCGYERYCETWRIRNTCPKCRRAKGDIKANEMRSEYKTWVGMKGRCYNVNNKAYNNYGGRNIKVCDRWMQPKVGYDNFISDIGSKPEPKCDYSIDRINNDGNYEPSNCRWSTRDIQLSNKRPQGRHYNKTCCVCCKDYTAVLPKSIYCSRACQSKAHFRRLELKAHPQTESG